MVTGAVAAPTARSLQTWSWDDSHVLSGSILFAQQWQRKCAPGLTSGSARTKAAPTGSAISRITKLAGGTARCLPIISNARPRITPNRSSSRCYASTIAIPGNGLRTILCHLLACLPLRHSSGAAMSEPTCGPEARGCGLLRRWTSLVAEHYYRLDASRLSARRIRKRLFLAIVCKFTMIPMPYVAHGALCRCESRPITTWIVPDGRPCPLLLRGAAPADGQQTRPHLRMVFCGA